MQGSTEPMLVEPTEEEVTGGSERRPESRRPTRSGSWALLGLSTGLLLATVAFLSSRESPPFLGSRGIGKVMGADEEIAEKTGSQDKKANKTVKARVESKTEEETPKVTTSKKPPKTKHCVDIPGVMLLAEDEDTEEAWAWCSPKWSEDCRQAGCCADWGMKCYEKDETWSACNSECKEGEGNDTWTCNQIWPPRPRTHETCVAMCREMEDCVQAVFTEDNYGFCKLSRKSSTTIVWAADNVNSTFCLPSKKDADELAAEVNKQIPWRLPENVRANCSFAGEDCSQTKCCNEYSCTKDFSNCWGYQCYKKTEYFSGCMTGNPPEDWDGTWVGGSREIRVIPPAGSKVQLMGTSLYCFMVVTWDAPAPKPFWSTEKELVNNIKEHGLSIYQCDGHHLYEGYQTERAEWGSFSNIDAFQNTWQQVRDDGNWANFDWTVKVDSDAVFLPSRLKQHLEKLRVPAGAAVYLENNDFRFRFMGALEIISQAAAKIWIEEGSKCIRGKHEGGEDFFMKGCMDFLGIDHMIDHDLLGDTYAGQDKHCTNGWVAAFHFYKSVIRWNWCFNEVVCGGKAKTCPEGLEVEYVMEDE